MLTIQPVVTYGTTQSKWLSNVSDLLTLRIGGDVLLLATTHLDGGISSYSISSPDAPLVQQDTQEFPVNFTYQGEPGLVSLTLPEGRNVAHLQLGNAESIGIALTGGGGLGSFAGIFNSADIGVRLTALGQFDSNQGSYIYSAHHGELGFSVKAVMPDGRLSSVSRISIPVTDRLPDASLDKIIDVSVGGQRILVAISGLGDFISTHLVSASGAIGTGDLHLAARGTGYAVPSNIAAVNTAGRDFLVMAGAGSSSLTVFRLRNDGSLETTDHILDEAGTRFQRVSALQTVEVGGRAFVIVGGSDDGISVFTLLPDGRLLHLNTLADSNSMTLSNVSDIAAQTMGSKIALFVSSSTETGLTQLSLDPGQIGATGFAAAGIADGTSGNDLLVASAGTTHIRGGNGDDIIVSVSGAITLTGGSGADLFVLSRADGRITISDFQPGQDRLDLSMLGMIRSTYQLSYVSRADGISVYYGSTELRIVTSDGSAMTAANFSNDMFPVAHYNLPELDPSQISADANPTTIGRYFFGTEVADTLLGGGGADSIVARGGDDTVSGGDGADTIMGGAGRDRLRGQDGDDSIHGDEGADTLFGDAGSDRLFGDDDDDLIYGGDGSDWLWGGSGADQLYGGENSDRLEGGSGNDTLSGEAGNDRLTDLEDNNWLLGGEGDDTLIAGDGANRLYGDDGADLLESGSGKDRLYGGSGDDTLKGGAGDDYLDVSSGSNRLYGEAGRDTLRGGTGRDYLVGGSDSDRLTGNQADDSLYGGSGNDTLYGGSHDDYLEVSSGTNRLYGQSGRDTLLGGSGRDYLVGGPDSDRLEGNGSNDRLYGDSGNDTLFGGSHHDYLKVTSGTNRLYGQSGHDTMLGGSGNDYLVGGSGSDRLYGNAGNDRLHGDHGDDTIFGGSHRDYLEVTSGTNRLYGQSGRDTLIGGNGRDYLVGGLDSDRLEGNARDDRLYGGSGNDTLFGGSHNDYLDVSSGSNRLYGQSGHDTLVGGSGRDYLTGGSGNDRLYGGSSHDRLSGGGGADRLSGGNGSDIFDYQFLSESRRGSAADLITDFGRGNDRIDLSAFDLTYIGRAGFSDDHQLRWIRASGETRVIVDINGDGNIDLMIRLSGHHNLNSDDFLL